MKEIIVAAITGIVTLVVCLLNNYFQQKKADIEQDKRLVETAHVHEKSMLQIQANNEQAVAEMNAQVQQAIAVLDCKFDELSKKVEKHNNIVERTYKLESDVGVIFEKLAVSNHRIGDLEKGE